MDANDQPARGVRRAAASPATIGLALGFVPSHRACAEPESPPVLA